MSMQFPLDEHGFLQDFDAWSPRFAEKQASEQQIALTEDHLDVIQVTRDLYKLLGVTPGFIPILRALKKKWPPEKVSSGFVQGLFGKNPLRTLCLLAGLPKPKRCI